MPVTAFYPRRAELNIGDQIKFPSNLRVVKFTKKTGQAMYLFKPGPCNFKPNESINESSFRPYVFNRYSSIYQRTDFEESRENYYAELGNSVCEYCGEYGCDCQRNLNKSWEESQY